MNLAPRVTASSSAVPRSVMALELASTSSSLQSGQTAEMTSRLSDVAADQPDAGAGRPEVLPAWLTMVRQPLATVQAESE